MTTTNILTVGVTAARSSDRAVAQGEIATLVLRPGDNAAGGFPPDVQAWVEVKHGNSGYVRMELPLNAKNPALQLVGPVDAYNVVRGNCTNQFGVDEVK